jgi:hypothetical protein
MQARSYFLHDRYTGSMNRLMPFKHRYEIGDSPGASLRTLRVVNAEQDGVAVLTG